MTNFVKWIKCPRGYQTELSKKTGVSQSVMSRVFQGEVPGKRNQEKLAKYFNVPASELFKIV